MAETGGGGPRGLRICVCWGGGGKVGWGWGAVARKGSNCGRSHFLFRFLGPGEPAAVDLSSPPTSCSLGGSWTKGWGKRRKGRLTGTSPVHSFKIIIFDVGSTQRQLVGASPAHPGPGRACIDFNVGLVLLVFTIQRGKWSVRVSGGVEGLRVERC